MPKLPKKDDKGQVTDYKTNSKKANNGIGQVLPINRNLSKKLFGQLDTFMERIN